MKICVCVFKYIRFHRRAGGGAGGQGPKRPFPRAGFSHPLGRKAAGEQSPPRLERGEGERSLRPVGPATGSLLRARGPSPAAPPSKASCEWGPE